MRKNRKKSYVGNNNNVNIYLEIFQYRELSKILHESIVLLN